MIVGYNSKHSYHQYKSIGILGAGGFAREVRFLIDDLIDGKALHTDPYFIDLEVGMLGDLPIKTIDMVEPGSLVVCGIGGTSSLRRKVIADSLDKSLAVIGLCHPSVKAGRWVDIGDGTIICAGNILTTNTKVGKYCQINLACTIGHDVSIGDYVVVSPGVHISGNVLIGDEVFIGTGANIIEGVTIGKGSIIGAGAAVTKDIPPHVMAAGVPARVIKELKE